MNANQETQSAAATRSDHRSGSGTVDEDCEYCGKRDFPVYDVSQYVCSKCLDEIYGPPPGHDAETGDAP